MNKSAEKTFAERIREAARGLGEFTARDIAAAVDVKTFDEKRAVSANIREFLGRGEMARVNGTKKSTNNGTLRYRYVGLKPRGVTNRQRLWNVVRRLPAPDFTMDDLEQMTGVPRKTVKNFCYWLVNSGNARRLMRGKYRRVGLYGTRVPADKLGAERLRVSRKGALSPQRHREKTVSRKGPASPYRAMPRQAAKAQRERRSED